ncbi:hypothetical protein RQN30_01380 [Arcanobacterium hippocoleae]
MTNTTQHKENRNQQTRNQQQDPTLPSTQPTARTPAEIITVENTYVYNAHSLTGETVLPSETKTTHYAASYVNAQALCHHLR